MSTRAARIAHLIRTVGIADRVVADSWVRSKGLTMAQGLALGWIEAHRDRELIARDLAEVSGTTPASVTSLLQGLEERGYVVRRPAPDDARRKLIEITDEGARLIAGFEEDQLAAQRERYSILSAEEQDQLIALLTRLADAGPPIPER